MPQFQGIPALPMEKMPQWQYDLLLALKENIEILMGQRGPGRAVTNDSVGVVPDERQSMTQLSSRGDFFSINTGSGIIDVPQLADYIKLLNDTQQLASDVAKIQQAFNALLTNLNVGNDNG
jgi:hypothetical protein